MQTFISDASCPVSVFYLFIMGVDTLKPLLESFPSSLYMARKIIGLDRDAFNTFFVCPKCHLLYTFEVAMKTSSSGKKYSAKCSNILYPNHPQHSRRMPCGAFLMKKIVSEDGKTISLYRKKVYCYLEQMMLRPGFKKDLLGLNFKMMMAANISVIREILD